MHTILLTAAALSAMAGELDRFNAFVPQIPLGYIGIEFPTTKSELGPITVTFGHLLKEDTNGVTITHTVTIECL